MTHSKNLETTILSILFESILDDPGDKIPRSGRLKSIGCRIDHLKTVRSRDLGQKFTNDYLSLRGWHTSQLISPRVFAYYMINREIIYKQFFQRYICLLIPQYTNRLNNGDDIPGRAVTGRKKGKPVRSGRFNFIHRTGPVITLIIFFGRLTDRSFYLKESKKISKNVRMYILKRTITDFSIK